MNIRHWDKAKRTPPCLLERPLALSQTNRVTFEPSQFELKLKYVILNCGVLVWLWLGGRLFSFLKLITIHTVVNPLDLFGVDVGFLMLYY